jgi:hypothetical protein
MRSEERVLIFGIPTKDDDDDDDWPHADTTLDTDKTKTTREEKSNMDKLCRRTGACGWQLCLCL